MKYVVGDIHGEITKLSELVNNILIQDPDPEFVFIGDYLDKGEDVVAALKYLIELEFSYPCVFLYGNHEYLWLNLNNNNAVETAQYLNKYGGVTTIKSLKAREIFDAQKILLERFEPFFLKLRPYWYDDSFMVVHSGISPEDYNINIKDIHLQKLLFNRYDFLKNEQNMEQIMYH